MKYFSGGRSCNAIKVDIAIRHDTILISVFQVIFFFFVCCCFTLCLRRWIFHLCTTTTTTTCASDSMTWRVIICIFFVCVYRLLSPATVTAHIKHIINIVQKLTYYFDQFNNQWHVNVMILCFFILFSLDRLIMNSRKIGKFSINK